MVIHHIGGQGSYMKLSEKFSEKWRILLLVWPFQKLMYNSCSCHPHQYEYWPIRHDIYTGMTYYHGNRMLRKRSILLCVLIMCHSAELLASFPDPVQLPVTVGRAWERGCRISVKSRAHMHCLNVSLFMRLHNAWVPPTEVMFSTSLIPRSLRSVWEWVGLCYNICNT